MISNSESRKKRFIATDACDLTIAVQLWTFPSMSKKNYLEKLDGIPGIVRKLNDKIALSFQNFYLWDAEEIGGDLAKLGTPKERGFLRWGLNYPDLYSRVRFGCKALSFLKRWEIYE